MPERRVSSSSERIRAAFFVHAVGRRWSRLAHRVSCPRLYIVGGGSRDALLNRLTAQATGKEVFTGPSEGTAVGNLLAQLLAQGVFSSVAEARGAVRRSFPVGCVRPRPQ